MLEKQLIAQGSPTLAGLKTASLFSVPYTDLAGLSRELGRCRRVLAGKGLTLRVLRRWPGRVLVYVYRPDCLCRDLAQPGVKAFLRRQGYSALEPEQALGRLCRRLRAGGEFPHEIGLFLDYPLEDVVGFVENQGKNCKCVGCWKVYGDAQAAKRRFAQFKACQRAYDQAYRRGKTLAQLTVPS